MNILFSVCLLLCVLCSRSVLVADRPNVLFIAVDDLKPSLGSYGDPVAHSPEIDRLASRGTVFLNAQCQQPICGPSRASLLTGLRPDTTRVYDLKTRMREINPDVLTLPQYFKQQGYRTVGMGKIFDPRCVDGRKFQDKPSWSEPFEYYYGIVESEGGYIAPETVAWFRSQTDRDGNRLNPWAVKNRPPTEGSEEVPDNAYHDGATAEGAVAWMERLAQEDDPFFLAVGFQKPHLPFNAPKQYWDLYDREALPLAEYREAPVGTPEFTLQPGWELRGGYDVPERGRFPEDLQRELVHGYYACVSYIDAQVGKLLDALRETGLEENTVIVLWGDHGWHLGDHSMWCKHSVYEQAARSPLILAAPGQNAPGALAVTPAEFTDIFPTLCELAGLPVPEHLEGVSLVPVLQDPSANVRDIAMSQFPREHDGRALMGYTFRDERYRYTEWRERKDKLSKGHGPAEYFELYDYQKDPLETRNLIEDPAYAEVLARMQKLARRELMRYGIE